MTDWNIQSRGRACEACGKGFEHKEAYHTLLFAERSELRRIDVCLGCWGQQYSEARERKGFVSHWQGVFESPPPPTETLKKETAETLLRKVIELNDPKYIPAAYILAVMLERKRLLKVKQQVNQEGKRLLIYEQPGTGDLFTVVDPELQLHQLEAVQRDVAMLLEHGLETPAPAATEQPATEQVEPAPAEPGSAEADVPPDATPEDAQGNTGEDERQSQ